MWRKLTGRNEEGNKSEQTAREMMQKCRVSRQTKNEKEVSVVWQSLVREAGESTKLLANLWKKRMRLRVHFFDREGEKTEEKEERDMENKATSFQIRQGKSLNGWIHLRRPWKEGYGLSEEENVNESFGREGNYLKRAAERRHGSHKMG